MKARTYKPSVAVRLESNVGRDIVESVRELVSSIIGVLDVKVSRTVDHLVMVEYDAGEVNSFSILDRIRNAGVKASLVGM